MTKYGVVHRTGGKSRALLPEASCVATVVAALRFKRSCAMAHGVVLMFSFALLSLLRRTRSFFSFALFDIAFDGDASAAASGWLRAVN